MGSLRGQLTVALMLPSAAWAEVCDKERPGWDGAQVTAIGEAIALFSTPLGLILLIATAFAIRFRSSWGGLAVTVGWTVFVSIVISGDPTGIKESAISEGCIGPPTLFIALAIAISVATILYTARTPAGDN